MTPEQPADVPRHHRGVLDVRNYETPTSITSAYPNPNLNLETLILNCLPP
jgi:hypothetical protein